MTQVLTAVAPTLYAAARVVPTELTGFLGFIATDFDDQVVAQGGTVKVPVVPRMTIGSAPSPSMSFSAGTDRTPTTIDFTLSQTTEVSWNLTGEQERLLLTAGNAQEILRQTVEGAFRETRNTIEAYLGTVAKNSASRSLGTSGTTPFASNFDTIAGVRRILRENGARQDGRALIINSAAEENLGKLTTLYKVNEAGTPSLLRDGNVGRLHGFDIRPSAGVASHTAGTGASYVIDGTGNTAAGSTTLKLKTGTGTVLAGDAITIGSYTYVVKTALAATLVVIQEPGLKAAVADGDTITVAAAYAANIALQRDALKAIVRPLLQPQSPEVQQMVLSDPETGFSALLLRKVGDQMASWYLRTVYDAFAPNPYSIASLRG